MRRSILLLTLVGAAALVAGCADGGNGTGRFSLDITDAPGNIDDFTHLNVTVEKIVLTRDDNGTSELEPTSNDTFDLRTLVDGNVSRILNASVPAGNYTRLDLHFRDALGTLVSDGSVIDVKAPSGRIFLNAPYTVEEGRETVFLFDIEVHRTGNGEYQFKPNAQKSGTRP